MSETGDTVALHNATAATPAKPAWPQRAGHFLWLHHWFVLAACIAAALGTWQAARTIMGPAVVVDVVRRGALIETVVATGSVQTPFRVSVGSQITGTVTQVKVDEGQRVSQGQTLIELDACELAAAMAQAQGIVDQAQARMRQLQELTLPMARETLKEAQANSTNAQQTFDRAAKLSESGFETRVALDAAKKNVDVAHTQVRTAEPQVCTATPGGSDFVMAQTQLGQAKSSLATANLPPWLYNNHGTARRRADHPQRGAGLGGAAGRSAAGLGAGWPNAAPTSGR